MNQSLNELRVASNGASLEFSSSMAEFSNLVSVQDIIAVAELSQAAEKCFLAADIYKRALENLRDGISSAPPGEVREGESQRTEKLIELLAVEREAISRILSSTTSTGKNHRTKSAREGKGHAEREFMSSETARKLAENKRVAAEKKRVSAEAEREFAAVAQVEAERKRVAAEMSRSVAEDERSVSEHEREVAETIRGAAEDARKASEELRTTAEMARQAAEKMRSVIDELQNR